MLKSCSVCGKPSDETRCAKHRRNPNASWSTNRDRQLQARFRREVLARDGHRCIWLLEDNTRCTATTDLRAHHRKPVRDFAPGDPDAYDPRWGLTLCQEHDRLMDPYAR